VEDLRDDAVGLTVGVPVERRPTRGLAVEQAELPEAGRVQHADMEPGEDSERTVGRDRIQLPAMEEPPFDDLLLQPERGAAHEPVRARL
jgi:hypothetical protein